MSSIVGTFILSFGLRVLRFIPGKNDLIGQQRTRALVAFVGAFEFVIAHAEFVAHIPCFFSRLDKIGLVSMVIENRVDSIKWRQRRCP